MKILPVCRLLVLAIVFACGAVIAAIGSEPSAKVGVVAQRYPWNGMVDVGCMVENAAAGAQLVVAANGIEVARLAATNGEQKVSFDANKVEALKDRQIKDVKVTAKVEPAKK